ncbi:MAG: hypothetical protein HY868_07120 [Chloroflexi bacterium]|nr:hypothetical protein [Chloroflexota bacterium]
MRFTKTILLATIIVALLAIVFVLPHSTRAQAVAINVPIALAPLTRDTPIELTALTLDAEIVEINGRTVITGNSTFKLHNTDRLNDLSIAVGFPAWAGDAYTFDPARLDVFIVTLEGKKINTLNPAKADLRIGKEVRNVDWYTFTLAIAGDEKKTVRFDFQQDLGDSLVPRFTYGLFPATGWKGSVGSARLEMQFPENTTLEQIIAFDPPNPHFDGRSLRWNFTTNEPVANPTLTFIRPAVWSELNVKRRAAQQAPNDANARAALGNVLRQLALPDTPRRDSFYAQAIAELETAARLDPNQRAARQALAAIYEARAGAATGPRVAAYVQLAVEQWQVLATNDANARKQLAEDYFYLGLDAQTRGVFADAASYYDKARGLMPNGAGPLFTTERAAAQRKSLNLAWARALLEQNEVAPAADKARAALGDAFVATYRPPAFTVSRTQVTMTPGSRVIAFSLTPQPGDATRQSLTRTVDTWRQVGAGAEISADLGTLNLNIAFANEADLMNKLNALMHATPDQPDWALVRAALAPKNIAWRSSEDGWFASLDYREQVDLSPACAAFSAQLDALAPTLASLDKASPKDDEAQLKRALLQSAQNGWRAALAQGRVTYRAGENETRVEACAAREIALTSSPFRVEYGAAVVGVIIVLGIAAGVVVFRGKKSRNQTK